MSTAFDNVRRAGIEFQPSDGIFSTAARSVLAETPPLLIVSGHAGLY
jgi:hypothetical protein